MQLMSHSCSEVYQEVVVEASVLEVVSDGSPVGAVSFQHVHRIALSDASVRQQHVSHLQD